MIKKINYKTSSFTFRSARCKILWNVKFTAHFIHHPSTRSLFDQWVSKEISDRENDMSDSRLKIHARESGLARLRGIAWYRARGTIVFLYHLLVLLCLFSAGPCPCVGDKNQNKKTRKRRGTAVPVRRDGLGIAVRHAVRLAAEASREGAQFRRRGALRPLQPACHQEENAILLDWPRGDHLHSEHRDTTVKWCKSCPSRRACDDGLSFNFPPLFLSFSSFNSFVITNSLAEFSIKRAFWAFENI